MRQALVTPRDDLGIHDRTACVSAVENFARGRELKTTSNVRGTPELKPWWDVRDLRRLKARQEASPHGLMATPEETSAICEGSGQDRRRFASRAYGHARRDVRDL